MLAVARGTGPVGSAIDWHEAPAEAMPIPDQTFDVVLCGMGLQFFSDRGAGLREMRRVLTPRGRLLANLPGPTPPPFEAMASAFTRHMGPDSAVFVHAVFALHAVDEVEALAADAGFSQVEVRSDRVPLRSPSPSEFLWQYVHSTPMAAVVARADDACIEALERDFSERCRDFVDEGGALTGAVRMTTLTANP